MLLQHYFFNILYTKKIKGINKPRSDKFENNKGGFVYELKPEK